jgi:hypothetical protein
MGQRDFNDNVTQVNSFLLRNSLYIDKVHASLATQYLDNVFKLSHLVAQSRDKRAANSWHSTAALPTDALQEHEELKAAWKAVDESRDQLISDFRQVLQAGGG